MKKQMLRLPEGVLPGDIIMLWRIHFNTFTTESMIPQYFEYRYGVNATENIATLLDLGFAKLSGAVDSLVLLSVPILKKIIRHKNLAITGKKADLLESVLQNIPEKELETLFSVRRYVITEKGSHFLKKYDAIIQKHGMKK